MIFDRVPGTTKIFATLRNGNQTDRFECVPSVCANPTCQCLSVDLTFVAQEPKGDQAHCQKAQPKTSLDLVNNKVLAEFQRTASPEDIDFSERLVAEMDPQDFSLLTQLFHTYKNRYTEEAEPDTIEPDFDFNEIESASITQGYNVLLPYGNRLQVAVDGVEHLLLDGHCVRTDCDCTETYIEVTPIMPDGTFGEHAGTIHLDHASRQWRRAASDDTPCDVPAWRTRIETAIPDFYAKLSQRQARLRTIYAHCRKRHLKQRLATTRKTKTALPKKVGRNDLCPCGSGKKYKNCCMNVAVSAARRGK